MNLFFATTEKVNNPELKDQADLVKSDPVISCLMLSSASPLLALNDKRQILCANNDLLVMAGRESDESLSGQRIGEAIGCIHSQSMLGCGAAPWCRSCGVNMTILACLHDDAPTSDNVTICVNHPKGPMSRCFQAKCIPHRLETQSLVLLNLYETTRWRNLETLERYFLNDLSRSVTAIDCQARMARHSRNEDLQNILIDIERRTLLLNGDIRLHRLLLGQNHDRRSRRPSEISLEEVINLAVDSISESPYIVGKGLERPAKLSETNIFIDWEMLVRVLQHMLLNAFEHSEPGRSVRLGFVNSNNGEFSFSVWNHKEIVEPMRARVFQRHFSSRREPGRGLGTYAIKLLSEGFLGGQVSFATADTGTTFHLRLSLK